MIPIFFEIIHHHESVLAKGIKAFLDLHGPVTVSQEKFLGGKVFFGRVEKKPLLPEFFQSLVCIKKDFLSDSPVLKFRTDRDGKNLGRCFALTA